MSLPVSFRTLGPGDATLMRSVLSMFGEVFLEVETYSNAQPSTGYLERLLGRDTFMAETHRRQGIAKAMIAELQRIGGLRGAHMIFVHADHGDDPAIALYTRLGAREDVMHFDIATAPPSTASRAPDSQ